MLPLWDNIPTRSFPIVTIGLIAACFAVWFWQLGAPDAHIVRYAYYPCEVNPPCVGPARLHAPLWENAFSSMFMHGSWSHILGNMLFLWIFGNNVEDAMGKLKFLVFYIGAGLAATATQTFVTIHWAGKAAESIPNLGASGAIAGVLGAYFVLYPQASVLTLFGFFVFPVPAFFFLGFWFLFQLWEGGFAVTHPAAGGGVAFFAHVGGFVFGLVMVRVFARRARPLRPAW